MFKWSLIGVSFVLAFQSIQAFDAYLPIKEREFQINLGVTRTTVNGFYDDNGDEQGPALDYQPIGFPVQGKFGLLPGVDVELEAAFVQKSSEEAGFDRPILTLKYAHPSYNAGGFINATLPFGFEDIVSKDPNASLGAGALYGKDWISWSLLTNASYTFNFEDANLSKKDSINFFVRGEYVIRHPRLAKQHLGFYLGASADLLVNSSGSDVKDGNLLRAIPGILYQATNYMGAEVQLPITVAGKNQASTTTLKAELHFFLDL